MTRYEFLASSHLLTQNDEYDYGRHARWKLVASRKRILLGVPLSDVQGQACPIDFEGGDLYKMSWPELVDLDLG